MLTLQEFKIHLGSHWSKGTGFVEGKELDAEGEGMDEDDD